MGKTVYQVVKVQEDGSREVILETEDENIAKKVSSENTGSKVSTKRVAFG